VSDEQPSDALTGEVRDTLVVQPHGGAIRQTPPVRIANPTATDVAQKGTKYLYKELPRLRRIAHNETQRKAKTKRGGKPETRRRGRREFTVEQQLSAFRALVEIAKLDRTVRVAAVDEFIAGIVNDVRSYLPKASADALLAMFNDRARRI
jgi:hypothetical protein